jgi:glycosyltransferase involved in cell wall biosynthesis
MSLLASDSLKPGPSIVRAAAADTSGEANGHLEVSIVMPCLNEAETLATCVAKAQQALQQLGVAGEVIVADNGSTDGSVAIATRLGARVVPVERKGYGSALLGGIAAARGTYVIMGDADDSYDFTALAPFVSKLREGYDLVMGNRFAGGIKPGAMPFLNRYLGNPILTAVARLLFHRPGVHDFHCGLRGFSREAAARMKLRTTGMEFASEMVVKAVLYGMRIAEVPTTLSPDGRSRAPHLRRWRDGWRHLRFLLLYSPRWLFMYPGVLLMAVAAGLGAWLLPGPRTVGGVVLDIHTLLFSAAALIVGFQAVVFGVFTMIFGVTEELLPPDRRLDQLFQYVTLEVGLLVGGMFLVAGFVLGLFSLGMWQASGFGPLNAQETLRVAIPSVTLAVLGSQIVLSSFVLSFLGLRRL